jgi:deazaflavin-dependent oxidoreductase (nitroreductase family)
VNENFDIAGFQRGLITEFRDNGGKLSGMFEGWRLVLLNTVGARSGQHRTSLLGYLEIGGKGIVVASAMGAANHPAWYHNIRKNPMVTVETGAETYEAIAGIPQGQERDGLFSQVLDEAPGFAEHQAKTTREIPVVVLHRVGSELDRVKGMGDWLVEVHDWLREELAELRRQADKVVDGTAGSIERTPPDLGQEMRVHCLNFCGALKRHHTGEDMATFPMLARQFPALAPALAKLGAEHVVVARLQTEIQQLVDGYVPGESDPVRLRDELDRLASELETHFAYEEQTVVTALNATAPAPVF